VSIKRSKELKSRELNLKSFRQLPFRKSNQSTVRGTKRVGTVGTVPFRMTHASSINVEDQSRDPNFHFSNELSQISPDD
jgi:hypothetical protein